MIDVSGLEGQIATVFHKHHCVQHENDYLRTAVQQGHMQENIQNAIVSQQQQILYQQVECRNLRIQFNVVKSAKQNFAVRRSMVRKAPSGPRKPSRHPSAASLPVPLA